MMTHRLQFNNTYPVHTFSNFLVSLYFYIMHCLCGLAVIFTLHLNIENSKTHCESNITWAIVLLLNNYLRHVRLNITSYHVFLSHQCHGMWGAYHMMSDSQLTFFVLTSPQSTSRRIVGWWWRWLVHACDTTNYLVVFNPKWDMRWLRAKEIKDSPNSQAVPKILVHKTWHCLVPHWLRFPLHLQYSLAWLVSPS